LIAVIYGSTCCLGGQTDEYRNWLFSISNNGSSFPTWEDMKPKYLQFLEKFKQEKPEYNFPTDNKLIPTTLFKPIEGCE
jgi:hypothetical protein